MGVHDHGAIVWDEVVGLLITMIAAPAGWGWLLVGFGLFRFFDIIKPWPIRWLDAKVHGGFGIMIDDVLAGVFSFICLQGLVWFFS
jgi:phosphatidylglycerophosphatase A